MFILANIHDFVNTKFYFPIVEFLGKWEVKCGFYFSFGGKIGKEGVGGVGQKTCREGRIFGFCAWFSGLR